jgi:hypothetical protein
VKEANNIEELFKSKLQDLESPVRADLWNNIAAQSGIQTSFWSASKIAAASVAVLVLSGSLLFWQLNSDEAVSNASTESELVQEVLPENQEIEVQPVLETEKETPNALNTAPETVQHSRSEQSAPLSEKQEKAERIEKLPEPTPVTEKREAAEPLKEQAVQAAPQEKQVAATPKPVEKVIETETASKVDKFEAAERLDLEVLIAPEKREEVSRESKHYPSAFPRIFNPNVPGDAGTFSIDVRDVSYFKIEIRNQKGHLMFSTQDVNFVWKGTTLDGSMAPEGTYLFLIESNDLNGEALKPQSGAVFLMRK